MDQNSRSKELQKVLFPTSKAHCNKYSADGFGALHTRTTQYLLTPRRGSMGLLTRLVRGSSSSSNSGQPGGKAPSRTGPRSLGRVLEALVQHARTLQVQAACVRVCCAAPSRPSLTHTPSHMHH